MLFFSSRISISSFTHISTGINEQQQTRERLGINAHDIFISRVTFIRDFQPRNSAVLLYTFCVFHIYSIVI